MTIRVLALDLATKTGWAHSSGASGGHATEVLAGMVQEWAAANGIETTSRHTR